MHKKIKISQNYIMNEGYSNTSYRFSSGSGSNVFISGKKYIDLSNAAGSLILGHNSKIYKKAIKKSLTKNLSIIAAPNAQAESYSKLLKQIFPNYSKFIFCNSGTEAVFKSVRIARAISKKNKIVSVVGSWHGSVDSLLYSTGKNLKPFELSAGLTKDSKKNIIFIPYNDVNKSKQILDKFKKDISSIIIEPVQGCLPIEKPEKYLKFLNNYSKKNNIILIFDEMITGLRVKNNSIQNTFRIKPSISTFGKCFGGGLPIGIIAVSKKIENLIKKKKINIFFGGTFSGNSLAAFVGQETTRFIIKNKNKIIYDLEKKSQFFQNDINSFCVKNNINAKVYRFGSLIRIIFSNKIVKNRIQRDFLEKNNLAGKIKLRNFLFKNKIYYSSNGLIFFSYSTTKYEIKKVVSTFKLGLKRFIK
jgi:glutamate-1-semialdehyde 2,1-aminomutase